MKTSSKPPAKPRQKRSVPMVDELGPRVKEQLTAAALTASKVHTEALDRVERGQAETRAVLRSMHRTQFATLALLAALSVFVAAEAFVRGHQIDSLERRIDRLEKTLFQGSTP